jgi:hypothetical protein
MSVGGTPVRAGVLAALALALWTAPGAEAKRRTDCERPGSQTHVETSGLRVYSVRRGKRGARSHATYACHKGSKRKPILLFDDRDGPGEVGAFQVLGSRVAMTAISCDGTGGSCESRASLLNVHTRRSLSGPAGPAEAQAGDWEAVRALPSRSGALVYSAQSPMNAGGADRPVTDSRIVVVGADRVVHELDRGPTVESDSLAVAYRTGLPSLFTWRSHGVLRSAEL